MLMEKEVFKQDILIKVDKEILENNNINDEMLLSYCLVKSLSITRFSKVYISKDIVIDMVGKVTDRFIRNLNKNIKALADLGYLTILSETKSLIVIKTEITKDDKPFTYIYYSELEKICTLDSALNVLRYFLNITGCIDRRNEIQSQFDECAWLSNPMENTCYYAQETISKKFNISEKTIVEYNSLLQENELLYICKSHTYSKGKNTIKTIANVTSRYCDKEQCENASKHLIDKEINKVTLIEFMDVEKKRLFKIKLGAFKKRSKKYKDDFDLVESFLMELKQYIHSCCNKWNMIENNLNTNVTIDMNRADLDCVDLDKIYDNVDYFLGDMAKEIDISLSKATLLDMINVGNNPTYSEEKKILGKRKNF